MEAAGFDFQGGMTIAIQDNYFLLLCLVKHTCLETDFFLTGDMEIHDDGIALKTILNGYIYTPFMELDGDFELFINTRNTETLGIVENTSKVILSDLTLLMAGLEITGNAEITTEDGVFRLDNFSLRTNIRGILDVALEGYIVSNGEFYIHGSNSISIGNKNIIGLSGDMDVVVSSASGLELGYEGAVFLLENKVSEISAKSHITEEGFELTTFIDAYVYRGLWINGDMTLQIGNGGIYAEYDGNAGLWGLRGNLNGYFNTQGNSLRYYLEGGLEYSFHVGFDRWMLSGHAGAWGKINVAIGTDEAKSLYLRRERLG